jgi:hypothetical protein
MMTHDQFYAAANLKENPFRSNAATDADPRQGVWVGYKKERITFTKFLERSRADQVGNVNFVLIYGDYGVGKSHALLWAQYQILHAKRSDYNSCAYYIQTLMREKGKLSFADAFRQDVVGKSNIVADILQFRQFVEEVVVEFKKETSLGTEVWDVVIDKMVASIEMRNVLKRMRRCEDEAGAREFLEPESDHDAVLRICQIVNAFVHPFELGSGKRQFRAAVYMFIDEVDLVADASAKEAREVNIHLRHIIDLCPSCFFLGLGFTATSAEIGVLFADYVLSRVTKQIVLEYMQPSEAKDFVREILNIARVDSKKKKDYFPFTEQAIDTAVSQIVSITPRKVVNTMQQVIEECRLAGLDPGKAAITPEMLDKAGVWESIG